MIDAVNISGIYKAYRHLQALKGIDLTIQQGEFFGLLGPNGAGKTTLISILAGLVRADAGHVKILEHDVVQDFRLARRALGVVPQEIVFDPFFTVRETLRIQSGYFGLRANDDWIDEVLFNLDLTAKADTNMRALSGGMKRRVLVAQAIVHKPPVMVLDEPTAGVDVELRQTLWKFISRLNREGHTIILTTHYLEEAQNLCGRIAMLKQGQIIALDQTHRLLKQCASLQLILRFRKDSITPALLTKISQSNQFNQNEISAQLLVQETKENDQLRWHLSNYDQVEPILAYCRSHAMMLEEIDIQKADLEDVFIQLMSTSL